MEARLPVRAGAAGAAVVLLLLGACAEPPPPRSYAFFMEDTIARDGVLARCDREPDQAQRDIECANARRAATAVLLREERERREELERQSERKLAALRRQFAAEQRALREAEQEASERAVAALYEKAEEPLPVTAEALDGAPAAAYSSGGAGGAADPTALEATAPGPQSAAALE